MSDRLHSVLFVGIHRQGGLSQSDLAAKVNTAQTNIARLKRGGSVPRRSYASRE